MTKWRPLGGSRRSPSSTSVSEIAVRTSPEFDSASESANSRLSVWISDLKIAGMPASLSGSVADTLRVCPAPTLNEYHAGELTPTSVVYWPAP